MQIFENLYWLNGRSSNAFLYEDEEGFVLVDSGMPNKIDAVAYLAQLGHKPDALQAILVTHADIDHIGNVEKTRQVSGATVYAGAESAELLTTGNTSSHNFPLMKAIIDRFMRYQPVPQEHITIVNDGDVLPLMGGLRVLASPGHTSDHIAFHSMAQGIVFAGDALHTRRGKLQCSPWVISADFDLAQRSAIKLGDLAPAVFACGHGKPFLHTFDDLMMLLDECRVA